MKTVSINEMRRLLAKNIRQCRLQSSLSQADLAKAMNKTKAWIQRQESNGRLSIPDFFMWCATEAIAQLIRVGH